MVNSINKGKAGELAACKILHLQVVAKLSAKECKALNITVPQRRLNQSRSGGSDIDGFPMLSIEVKNADRITLGPWWKQTKAAAGKDQLPVLIFKRSRGKWEVMTYASFCGEQTPVFMMFDQFAARLTSALRRMAEKKIAAGG